jgi:hypothetical protein
MTVEIFMPSASFNLRVAFIEQLRLMEVNIAKLAVEALALPNLQGKPGSAQGVPTPNLPRQFLIAVAMNSWPLSHRTCFGTSCIANNSANESIASSLLLRLDLMLEQSRVCRSKMPRNRI